MNSVEKKVPEPSMDDIISSIRNIISDEPQESAPVPGSQEPTPVVPAVVQLTENQIAAPVAAEPVLPVDTNAMPLEQQAPEPLVSKMPPAVPSPEILSETPPAKAEVLLEQSPVQIQEQQLSSAQVASEIGAVPGVMVASQALQPAPPPVQQEIPPLIAPLVPETVAVVPEDVAAIEVTGLSTADIAQTKITETKATSLTARLDDLSSASQATLQDMPITDGSENDLSVADDPIVDLIETSRAPGYEDTFDQANGVNPDQILDGMKAEPQDMPVPATKEDGVKAAPEVSTVGRPAPDIPTPAKQEEKPPVVLDASKVTPEDAVAISAVATATSEALAGTSAPVTSGGPSTLEDSIKAMMKPMIREWLDDNMPRILEGAIKEEVKGSDSDDV